MEKRVTVKVDEKEDMKKKEMEMKKGRWTVEIILIQKKKRAEKRKNEEEVSKS